MSAWKRYNGSSIHVDGHKTGIFGDDWWFYPFGWPKTADAQGPFKSREEAEHALDNVQLLHSPSRYAEVRP